MAWEHLSIDKPHLVYIILGGFTSLFMLCSSVIKERFYIGEATVATLCGIIFGPYAANLIDPSTWGNTDRITLEFSRIVLVVQCFAVGVELPKAYMERHWRSVVFLLVPVMTFGWLITSLFIWGTMHNRLDWLDSLVCAACVTATDPVLASSVVGKGKFAKRVPKHLRDLLSAESGCNDGMAFPFIYLGIYLVRYRPDANQVAFHWFCYTILYECIFGAVYGVAIGYCARRAIRYAHEKDLIDRESFLVFYFVLALFCAGSGSLLGMDDLLVGFACGVGFSNDGWFTEKTEETHVSNVIDLLINLAFFVYFGTIIPWSQYNSQILGTSPWQFVVIAILVLLLRRIPIMMMLKPAIPDIKTWREALFAGHFGPIGVGAIFVAILARAELETETTTPENITDLATIPDMGFDHPNIIELIWPITTFLVITSIVIHGSSIAVFTLGKHINTLTLTMSYTRGEASGDWMDRLPRIQSRSRSSMSKGRGGESEDEESGLPEYPANVLPKNFLRRQKEEDTPRPIRRRPFSRSSRKSSFDAGGPVDPSAIMPQRPDDNEKSESDTLAPTSSDERQSSPDEREGEPEEEVYEEGNDTVIEDEEGNVLEVRHSRLDETEDEKQADIKNDLADLMVKKDIHHGVSQRAEETGDARQAIHEMGQEVEAAAHGPKGWKAVRDRMKQRHQEEKQKKEQKESERKRGPARAYRFGRTIIVEDEDGEVIKKYDIPGPEREKMDGPAGSSAQRIQRMGKFIGLGTGAAEGDDEGTPAGPSTRPSVSRMMSSKAAPKLDPDDDRIRFRIHGEERRMSKVDFIKQIQSMDPKSRADVVETADVPNAVKREARREAGDIVDERQRRASRAQPGQMAQARAGGEGRGGEEALAGVHKMTSRDDAPQGPQGLAFVDEDNQAIPFHAVSDELKNYSQSSSGETAAERRRRQAASRPAPSPGQPDDAPMASPRPLQHAASYEADSDDDGTERKPPTRSNKGKEPSPALALGDDEEGETAAERRRREAALGTVQDSSESGEEHEARTAKSEGEEDEPDSPSRGIRFADPPPSRQNHEPGGGRGPRIRFKDNGMR